MIDPGPSAAAADRVPGPSAAAAPDRVPGPSAAAAPDRVRVPEPERPRSGERRSRRGPLGAILAAIVAFGAKLKALLLLVPKLKLLTTAGTMLVSVAAYALLWGWEFAVGFVILLLVHEMGHVVALRREGVKASAPMFIPFLGAVISSRSLGSDALAEARVGLAGPLLGTLGAVVCVGLWHATGNDLFRALAYIGFLLNLFNLLPVVPLDGGRAMAAMAPWLWFVGFAGMVALALRFPNPIFILIILFAARETLSRWRQRRRGDSEQEEYYRVRPLDRVLVGAVYLALVALLAVGMHATYFARTLS